MVIRIRRSFVYPVALLVRIPWAITTIDITTLVSRSTLCLGWVTFNRERDEIYIWERHRAYRRYHRPVNLGREFHFSRSHYLRNIGSLDGFRRRHKTNKTTLFCRVCCTMTFIGLTTYRRQSRAESLNLSADFAITPRNIHAGLLTLPRTHRKIYRATAVNEVPADEENKREREKERKRERERENKRATFHRISRVCLRLDLTNGATMLLSLPVGDREFHPVADAFPFLPPSLPPFYSPFATIVNYNRENTAFRDIKRTGSRFK